MRKLRGFTLIELLIVVAIIAILAAIAVPNFLEAQVRSKVSRVRSDQRSLATALESYYVDNNNYPAMGATTATTPQPRQTVSGAGRTFRIRNPSTGNANQFNTLTTPIAYITSYFGDPFADTRGLVFRYYHDRAGWILGSWGPDTDQSAGGDLEWNQGDLNNLPTGNDVLETVYTSQQSQPSPTLLTGSAHSGSNAQWGAYTYDPTNGTVSQGDVWRVNE